LKKKIGLRKISNTRQFEEISKSINLEYVMFVLLPFGQAWFKLEL